jgi:hypothetical protein
MLKRLRRLVLNSNRIKVIPIDIGQLEMLEELILSENSIEEIPQTIAMMTNLKVVKISNNRLRSIPFELADVMTLEEIDCGNNPNLDMVYDIETVRSDRPPCKHTYRSFRSIYVYNSFPVSSCRYQLSGGETPIACCSLAGCIEVGGRIESPLCNVIATRHGSHASCAIRHL